MFYQRMALINEYTTSYPPIKKLAEKYQISDPTVRKILSEAGVYEPWGFKNRAKNKQHD